MNESTTKGIVYSPYQRMNDRVATIRTMGQIQKDCNHRLANDYFGREPCVKSEQLGRMEDATLEMIIAASELLTAIRDEKRKVLS